MKIVSWNVNGLKAITRKGVLEKIIKENDVILLQEIRSNDIPLDLLISGLNIAAFPAKKKGYSGVMSISKLKPLSVIKGLGIEEFDAEGRVLTLEFEKFYVINTYFPRAGDGLSRLDFKLKFDNAIEMFALKLRETKSVIICGDFNAVRNKRDSSFWDENEPGLTPQERDWINNFLEKGFVDCAEKMSKIEYTWRSYRFKWKAMRIDYCLVSEELAVRVSNFQVLKVEGSDHLPIMVELSD
ncbi:exodeoxyribonuclease III [Stygiolobus caldivivus]|uniref:exodeoxyribonuclease III n=1 Tax=Stygiolobus caldivivus TaxID=2824673 RepID=UPI001C8411B8|nr:exodeoxyribonuclease III [Stygiolobus caldivivus]